MSSHPSVPWACKWLRTVPCSQSYFPMQMKPVRLDCGTQRRAHTAEGRKDTTNARCCDALADIWMHRNWAFVRSIDLEHEQEVVNIILSDKKVLTDILQRYWFYVYPIFNVSAFLKCEYGLSTFSCFYRWLRWVVVKASFLKGGTAFNFILNHSI